MIVVANLVDEMGRPEDADAFDRRRDPRTTSRMSGARLDVEPGRRLVEQQHARPMQQRARDLDPPHLTAGKEAHFVAGAVGEPDASELDRLSRARLAPANAMQRAVIGEVLRDAEIGIERALLEHDAKSRKRRAALARDVAAEDAHRSRSARIKMRDHREQRALAGAVQARAAP